MKSDTTHMKVLMVCLGNICRSPMAEGILRQRAADAGVAVSTDSAGTSDNHVGQAPDPRAGRTMQAHGMDISDLRARAFRADDFHHFDLILAMDEDNLSDVRQLAPSRELAAKARLIMDLVPGHRHRSVPDPYYGGAEGFEQVHDMLDQACAVLLDQLRDRG
jgi:protein-tyrosine phosphatase